MKAAGALVPVASTLAVAIGTVLALSASAGQPGVSDDQIEAAIEAARQAAAQAEIRKAPSDDRLGYTGAFDDNCDHAGRLPDGTEIFIAYCARSSVSPDGKWRLVNLAVPPDEDAVGEVVSDYVFIEDATGKRIGAVPGLSDAMPFTMAWSPRPNWFFVEHHVGSFMGTPEVYQITAGGVIRHDAFKLAAQAKANEAFPCLPVSSDFPWLTGTVMGWSKDGTLLAWMTETRADVCMEPGQFGPVRKGQRVWPMLLISNVDSGEVVAGSFRVMDDESMANFSLPSDGPYAAISRRVAD